MNVGTLHGPNNDLDVGAALYTELAESWILLNGKPFDLTDWPMHREVYNGNYPRSLLKTSRQVGKSTTMANLQIIESATVPYFSSMYVSPTKEQTQRYSATRVGKTMKYSPIIARNFLKVDLSDRVFHKQFTNGAEILFTYALDDPDRLRGPSTDRNLFDEVQDILYDPVITIGNETMSQSSYAYETYAGTPKSMENTIEYLWQTSTQSEWVMKCEGCGKYQFVANEESIGLDGPICLKCGKYLNPFEGFWVDMNPYKASVGYPESQYLKGFHFCQPVMPQNVPIAMRRYGAEAEETARMRWGRILRKRGGSPYVFRTEVLGVSDSKGTRLLTREDLDECCNEALELKQEPTTDVFKGLTHRVAGVDWSGGGDSGNSRTALWVWGFHSPTRKLRCLFYKVYPGEQPLATIDEIAQILRRYQVQIVVGDAGEGHYANDALRNAFFVDRVMQAQYGAQKEAIRYNDADRYMLDRTLIIDGFMMGVKYKEFEFVQKRAMKLAFDDFMNEYEEITKHGRRVWRHFPAAPDDCLHAAIFGWVAFKLLMGDYSVYRAGLSTSR